MGMQRVLTQHVGVYGGHGDHCYHYTSANAAFEYIVPTRTLRLSRLAEMRDPVENKDWVQVVIPSVSWSEDDARDFEAMAREVIYETQILSVTLDSAEEGQRPEHARGYARPRMWEQYAENHQGVCLAFNHRELKQEVEAGVARYRWAKCGPVVYSDLPLLGHERARSLSATDLALSGRGKYRGGLEEHLDEHAEELFLRKLSDWRTESEFRFIVRDAQVRDITVSFNSSLRAVILGERFPRWQLDAAAEMCAQAGAELRQIRWGAFPPGVFDPMVRRSDAQTILR